MTDKIRRIHIFFIEIRPTAECRQRISGGIKGLKFAAFIVSWFWYSDASFNLCSSVLIHCTSSRTTWCGCASWQVKRMHAVRGWDFVPWNTGIISKDYDELRKNRWSGFENCMITSSCFIRLSELWQQVMDKIAVQVFGHAFWHSHFQRRAYLDTGQHIRFFVILRRLKKNFNVSLT